MTSSSVGTLRSARKSVPGSTVAGSIPRYLSTAGVATKSCDSAPVASASGPDPPRELDRRKHPGVADDQGGVARLEGLAERDHRRLVESGGELRTRAARRSSWAGASTGVLRSLRRAEVDADLPVGEVGRLGRLLRLLGRGDDDDRRRDAERERDRRERRSGAGLVADEVSQRQSRRDRDAPGQAGEDADRQRARGAGCRGSSPRSRRR